MDQRPMIVLIADSLQTLARKLLDERMPPSTNEVAGRLLELRRVLVRAADEMADGIANFELVDAETASQRMAIVLRLTQDWIAAGYPVEAAQKYEAAILEALGRSQEDPVLTISRVEFGGRGEAKVWLSNGAELGDLIRIQPGEIAPDTASTISLKAYVGIEHASNSEPNVETDLSPDGAQMPGLRSRETYRGGDPRD